MSLKQLFYFAEYMQATKISLLCVNLLLSFYYGVLHTYILSRKESVISVTHPFSIVCQNHDKTKFEIKHMRYKVSDKYKLIILYMYPARL